MTEYRTESAWYYRIESEIENLKLTLDKKQAARYQLDLLKRIAVRLDEFSTTCSECEAMKQQLADLVQEAALLIQTPARDTFKRYRRSVSGLAAHLKKSHGLVDSGMYMGVGIAIGSGLGTALSAALDNYAFMGVGIGVGVAIGAALDARAKQSGKVI